MRYGVLFLALRSFAAPVEDSFAATLAENNLLFFGAVTADTLRVYLRSLSDFVDFAHTQREPRQSAAGRLDAFLDKCLNFLLRTLGSSQSSNKAKLVVSAVLAFVQEIKGQLSLISRTLRGYCKAVPDNERGPWTLRGPF